MKIYRSMLIIVWLILAMAKAVATPATGAITPIDLTQAGLEDRIRTLEAAGENGQGTKTHALELYREAVEFIKQESQDQAQAEIYRAAIDESKRREENLKALIAEQGHPVGLSEKKRTLADLEQALTQISADLQETEREIGQLNDQLLALRARPEANALEVSEAGKKLKGVEEQSKGSVDASLDSEARQINLSARIRALKARVSRLELERLSFSPRQTALNLNLELQQLRKQRLEEQKQAIQERLQLARSADVAKTLKESERTQQKVQDKHPMLTMAAEINAGLSEKLRIASANTGVLVKAKDQVAGQLKLVQQNQERTRQQLQIVGLDQSFGGILRKQRQEIPDERLFAKRIRLLQQQVGEIRLKQFELDDLRRRLNDEEQGVQQSGADLFKSMNAEQADALKMALALLLEDRRSLLEKLGAVYATNESVLSDTILNQIQLGDLSAEYADLLDRYLVWSPSTEQINIDVLKEALLGLLWILTPENGGKVVKAAVAMATQHAAVVVLALLVIALLLRLRAPLLGALQEAASMVGKVKQDSFLLTLSATLYTLLLALPGVILVMGLFLLLTGGTGDGFADAVSGGVKRLAIFFLIAQLLRYFFIENGLAIAHFGIKKAHGWLIRANLAWLIPVLVALGFIIGLTEWSGDDGYRNSLGRVAFLVSLVCVAIFFHRLLSHWGLNEKRKLKMQLELGRFGYFWVMGVLLLLAGLAVTGYYYSALVLERLLFWSMVVAMLVYLLYNLVIRWVLVADRRLAYSQALARRQEMLTARAGKEESPALVTGEVIPTLQDLEKIDLAALNAQTRRILRTLAYISLLIMFALIWSQLLPALSKFDDIVLWEHLGEGGKLIPISLWDGVLSLLVLILTFIAGRNLPGFLEITLLQPLGISHGNRYAISTLSSYLIYAVGMVVFFGRVGLSWGDVQWLIAAMGVGLGFGLKEIFSNFFSGLILLFERPLRVGDTVTVGEVSGTVSRIRMRATTITDFDNKELVIPNQNFLTDNLVNWTLTDTITRLAICVGIDYQADVELAHKVMLETVKAIPDVMSDPPPAVFFTGFGDSSLDFVIYVFVSERSKRLPVTDELHTSLNKALNVAGIGIPYPQRDLHLRSIDAVAWQGLKGDRGREK